MRIADLERENNRLLVELEMFKKMVTLVGQGDTEKLMHERNCEQRKARQMLHLLADSMRTKTASGLTSAGRSVLSNNSSMYSLKTI